MFSTTGTVSSIILLSVSVIARDYNPLFLTPLIESGDSAGARRDATVRTMLPGIESFSGYITVDKFHGAHLFFWMFKSTERNWEAAPVIIWLQGGPGGTSLFGLFEEIGPFYVNSSLHLTRREYSWCKKYNLLFIDNPVGAGFSFTTQEAGYAKTEEDVSKDLYSFMLQFYGMFPKLAKNPLFLMGQSYAGKFIPSFAEYIYKRNAENIMGNVNIPLEAIGIGNGFIDPYNMMFYGDYLYQLGLIDHHGRSRLHNLEDEARFVFFI
ncbi:vitellogenic carboxypeptidase-like [Bemisia tabaci]|uniref:vitellogenic carboxypeptidase-like n=1 Tax=Bemisia tabaci TaxID=7038 RepID=UPI003B27EB0E